MVFQQPNPFPMSVFDNVAYVLRDQAKRRPRRESLRPAVETALARAGLLDEVADNLDHPALRLSGGQQQRLCIARALAAQPEVLLLDEPCSALDPRSTAVIEDLVVKLREQVAVVIVTHNLQQAYRIADHVGFMYLGELVEYATAKALFGSPRRTTHEGLCQWCVRLGVRGGPPASAARSWRPGLRWPGCATTQQEAVRLRLNSARIRVSEKPTKVTVAGRALRVTRVALVRGRSGSAIVVSAAQPRSAHRQRSADLGRNPEGRGAGTPAQRLARPPSSPTSTRTCR